MNLKTVALCLAVLSPSLAHAQIQTAFTAKWVNLRAGPARDYPLVLSLGPNTPLGVHGCTDGFGWCDVSGPDGSRGWVYAGNIAYPYQNANVPVLGYGAVIGLPIVTFVIGNYWNQNYRNRPWYGNQGRWEHHRPPPRPIVRPPPRPPGPVVRPPPRPRPPGFTPPPGGGRPPGAGGGGRPPGMGGGGGRPPGGGGDGGRPPGAGGGEGRPPGMGGGGRPPGAGGGGRPPGGGGGGRPGGPGREPR